VEGEHIGHNAVGQHGERVFAVQHLPGALAAGKAVGQVVVKAGTHQPVQLAHQVVLIGSIVAVPCPHRHPAAAGHGIIKHAKAAVMPVDDLVFRVRGKKGAQVMQVFRDIIVLPHRQLGNVPAQGFNFSIIKAGLIIVVQKVKLYLAAVHGTVDIHDKGFHAAGVHGGHDL